MTTRIADRYVVASSLGRGGMGEVFAALDERTGTRVAVKVLRRADASPHGVERLLREAVAAGRVRHPNVVRVFEAGEDEARDVAFIAQELLDGETLRARLTREGRLDAKEAVSLLAPVADALAAAHEAGVVHRDLKPENIFLERVEGGAPRPRVIDFGIARLVDADPDAVITQLTTTGSVLGTPAYMSPEQARGARDIDEQTDVWALGVVLHEMLTGATPFARSSPHATLAAILLDAVPSVREAAPEVPEALAAAVLQCLARNRIERYGSARELRDALREIDLSPRATPTSPITSPSLAAPRPRSSRLVLPLSLGALGLAALLVSARAPRPIAPPSAPARVAPAPLPPAQPALAPPAPTRPSPAPSPDRDAAAPVTPVRRPTRRPVVVAPPSTSPRRVNGAPIVGL